MEVEGPMLKKLHGTAVEGRERRVQKQPRGFEDSGNLQLFLYKYTSTFLAACPEEATHIEAPPNMNKPVT